MKRTALCTCQAPAWHRLVKNFVFYGAKQELGTYKEPAKIEFSNDFQLSTQTFTFYILRFYILQFFYPFYHEKNHSFTFSFKHT